MHKVEVVEEVVVKTVATRVMKTVVVEVFSVVLVVPLVARVYPTTPLANTAIISERATSEFFILNQSSRC